MNERDSNAWCSFVEMKYGDHDYSRLPCVNSTSKIWEKADFHAKMGNSAYVEDEIGHRFDRCLTDTALKFGGGIFLGTVFSLLFFKRRRWPIILGGGFGLGMAYSNCEAALNEALAHTDASLPKAEKLCP
ncbi:hypothetical protein Trydic_g19519 [Trypoxylus dichotomus]